MPMEPPRLRSQSCGCAVFVGPKKLRLAVTPSSTTMAFSGISAARDWLIAAGEIAPVAGWGRLRGEIAASTSFAPSSSASHSRACTMSSSARASTWNWVSGCASKLGLPG